MEFVEFDKFLGFYVNLGLIIIEFGLEKKVKMLWLNRFFLEISLLIK